MTYIKETIKCPKCQKSHRIKLYSQLNRDHIPMIMDRSLFKHTCECGEVWTVDYPVLFTNDDWAIAYTHGEELQNTDDHMIKRWVTDYADFKEKIMIAEDNLNDIVLEFIKDFLRQQLGKGNEQSSMRYDGKTETHLCFYVDTLKKDIGCDYSFYENISKRIKLKKMAGFVFVDHNTYRQYMKLK